MNSITYNDLRKLLFENKSKIRTYKTRKPVDIITGFKIPANCSVADFKLLVKEMLDQKFAKNSTKLKNAKISISKPDNKNVQEISIKMGSKEVLAYTGDKIGITSDDRLAIVSVNEIRQVI